MASPVESQCSASSGETRGTAIPEGIRRSVRAVLLSKIGGVPLCRFPQDYRKLEGSALNYKELGYKNLRSCLEAMPDVVRFNYSEKADMELLYGIADPNSYMSSAAMKAQFSRPNDGVKEKKKMIQGKKKNQGVGRDSPSGRGEQRSGTPAGGFVGDSAHDDEDIRVPRNMKGLYTVCVRCDEPVQNKMQVIEEIRELFAEQGDVVEDSHMKGLMFFRFQHRSEAVDVIRRFNGRSLRDGKRIHVKPGRERLSKRQAPEGTPHSPASRPSKRERERERERGTREPVTEDSNGHISPSDRSSSVEICTFNLDSSTTDRDLINHFWRFGPERARVCKKELNGPVYPKHMYYGFVAFSCIASALGAQEALHRSRLKGNEIRIELAMSRAKLGVATTEEAKPTSNGLEGHTVNDSSTSGSKSPSRQERVRNQNGEEGRTRLCSQSGDESGDSISFEVDISLHSPPTQFHDEAPVVSDSPTAVGGSRGLRPQQSASEIGLSLPEGSPVGRGRGAWLGLCPPPLGRGLPSSSPPPAAEKKKKLRPSLADLIDKLDEL